HRLRTRLHAALERSVIFLQPLIRRVELRTKHGPLSSPAPRGGALRAGAPAIEQMIEARADGLRIAGAIRREIGNEPRGTQFEGLIHNGFIKTPFTGDFGPLKIKTIFLNRRSPGAR